MQRTTMIRFGNRTALVAASLLVVALCTGCRITKHSGDGKDDVSIDTPLGGMQVKSDPSRVLEKIGLPQYPGSVMVQKGSGHHGDGDNKSADVDMSFGGFHLRVLAAGFQTGDSQQAVEDFYRKALAQYSDVIACRGQQPVGSPAKTGMDLTCSDDENPRHSGHVSSGDTDELQLKAGSHTRQHIVAIKPKDGGTRLELIALELPNGDKD